MILANYWKLLYRLLSIGKRRSLLIQALSLLIQAFEAVLDKIEHRVAPFDGTAAQQVGDLMASRQKKGRHGDLRDSMIAGIVLAHHAALATRNITHFAELSVPVINPWLA